MFISTRSSANLLVSGTISVVIMTVVYALTLAYGPAVLQVGVEAIRLTWDAIVAAFVAASASIDHFFAIGQHAGAVR